MNNSLALKQKILTLADHCVKCGLCSSQCPTYRLKQDENESPRGRIAIAQGLAQNAISASNKASEHLVIAYNAVAAKLYAPLMLNMAS